MTQAIAEVERAIALDPNDADGYVTLAEVLTSTGQPEKALGWWRRRCASTPSIAEGYLGLSRHGLSIAGAV